MFRDRAIAAEPLGSSAAVLPGKPGGLLRPGARHQRRSRAGPSAGIDRRAGAVASLFILPVFLLQAPPTPGLPGAEHDCNAGPS